MENGQKRIAKMQTKVSKRIAKRQNGPKKIAKMHNRIQNLFRNEIKQLKRKINLLQDRLEQFKKRQLIRQGAETNRRNAESFTK